MSCCPLHVFSWFWKIQIFMAIFLSGNKKIGLCDILVTLPSCGQNAGSAPEEWPSLVACRPAVDMTHVLLLSSRKAILLTFFLLFTCFTIYN